MKNHWCFWFCAVYIIHTWIITSLWHRDDTCLVPSACTNPLPAWFPNFQPEWRKRIESPLVAKVRTNPLRVVCDVLVLWSYTQASSVMFFFVTFIGYISFVLFDALQVTLFPLSSVLCPVSFSLVLCDRSCLLAERRCTILQIYITDIMRPYT